MVDSDGSANCKNKTTGRVFTIVVEDTGVGISQEHQAHIFDRFYRVSEASMAAGAGIGLNLTKELVELLGGEIHVESPIYPDAERPGTRFTVFLPMDQRTEIRGQKTEDGEQRSEGRDQKSEGKDQKSDNEDFPLILIVEDDEDIRDFIIEGLQLLYRVEIAENGATGLQKAKEQVPDLIVTDIMMPVMDGIALCGELKTSLETSHIPVVMLTAKTSLESQIEGLKTGADDYVTKPFHMDLLKVRIANLLESRRLLRQQFLHEYPVLSLKGYETGPDREFFEKITAVLEKHYTDSGFTPDQLADAMHMSLRTMQRKIKAVANRTPQGFINEFRMARAAELLCGTSKTVTEITFDVGHEEPTNFSKMFKKYFGMSPSEYRTANSSSQGGGAATQV
jgi:CheY-like chemotaxis protein